jgi:hypothetical protein
MRTLLPKMDEARKDKIILHYEELHVFYIITIFIGGIKSSKMG